jgi:hypothetical protein
MMLLPEPTKVPPQVPLYQRKTPPVPRLPPLTVSVVLLPLQMVVVPVIAVGAEDKVFTLTVVVAQAVVLHVPSARTK